MIVVLNNYIWQLSYKIRGEKKGGDSNSGQRINRGGVPNLQSILTIGSTYDS